MRGRSILFANGASPWILALGALLALGTLNSELGGLQGDTALYVLLAKSLATGQGYRMIHEPGAPAHATVPFGFPLLLSPIVALWGSRAFWAMHAMVAAWGLFGLFLWHRWVRREAPAWVGLASMGLLATTPLWVEWHGQILSELPYIAFSLLALLCARRGWGALGPALLAAYFTRSAGLALVAALAGWRIWTRWREGGKGAAWREAAWPALLLLPPILLWTLRNSRAAEGTMAPYVRLFGMPDVNRITENLFYYLTLVGRILAWPTSQVAAEWTCFVGALLMVLVAAGWARRLALRSAAEWYTIGYAVLLAVWLGHELRYLLPILPWLWLYLIEGGRAIRGAAPAVKRMGRLLLWGLAAGNLAGCAWVVGLNWAGIHYYPPAMRGFVDLHRWVRAGTPPDAVIMSRKPHITALLADRKTVPIPYSRDPEVLSGTLSRHGVTHVLLDGWFQNTRAFLLPAIRRHPERFESETRWDAPGGLFGPTILLKVRQAAHG